MWSRFECLGLGDTRVLESAPKSVIKFRMLVSPKNVVPLVSPDVLRSFLQSVECVKRCLKQRVAVYEQVKSSLGL